MATSWHEALNEAGQKKLPLVFHDCDTDIYGACQSEEPQGTFKEGVFVAHRCICMPAHISAEELAVKEKIFRDENPDW